MVALGEPQEPFRSSYLKPLPLQGGAKNGPALNAPPRRCGADEPGSSTHSMPTARPMRKRPSLTGPWELRGRMHSNQAPPATHGPREQSPVFLTCRSVGEGPPGLVVAQPIVASSNGAGLGRPNGWMHASVGLAVPSESPLSLMPKSPGPLDCSRAPDVHRGWIAILHEVVLLLGVVWRPSGIPRGSSDIPPCRCIPRVSPAPIESTFSAELRPSCPVHWGSREIQVYHAMQRPPAVNQFMRCNPETLRPRKDGYDSIVCCADKPLPPDCCVQKQHPWIRRWHPDGLAAPGCGESWIHAYRILPSTDPKSAVCTTWCLHTYVAPSCVAVHVLPGWGSRQMRWD